MGIKGKVGFEIACDSCGKILRDPEDGFVIRGEIMVTEVDSQGVARGGLIGPMFKQEKREGIKGVAKDVNSFCENDIQERVLCRNCFWEALEIADLPIGNINAGELFVTDTVFSNSVLMKILSGYVVFSDSSVTLPIRRKLGKMFTGMVMPVSVLEVSRILGVSEDDVRRIRGDLRVLFGISFDEMQG